MIIRKLLKRSDIDVVHICTPNFLHYPMVKECLAHGKSVLCEKPLAMTADEARELMQLAAEKEPESGGQLQPALLPDGAGDALPEP